MEPEKFLLGPTHLPRIWCGLWQLSGNSWGGSAPASKIRAEMGTYAIQGYTAFADHYGDSEMLFGQFTRDLPPERKAEVYGATKWCVFRPMQVTAAAVEAAVDERLERMHTSRVDLLQFFWQDYQDRNYIAALEHLVDIQDQGKIRSIGLTNFDTLRTDEICASLDPGRIESVQVQFSIIDIRPLHGMDDVCARHGLKLLAYGTLCGGFLSDRWLGQPEPRMYSDPADPEQLNPSQRKYLDVILNAWGTWELFQGLLRVLRVIADRHSVSIANVAVRWVLDHPFVGAAIIGARLGLSEHIQENSRVFTFALTGTDRQDIEDFLKQTRSHEMITSIGDCGAEYHRTDSA